MNPSQSSPRKDPLRYDDSGPGWMPPNSERHACGMWIVPRPIRSKVKLPEPFQDSR